MKYAIGAECRSTPTAHANKNHRISISQLATTKQRSCSPLITLQNPTLHLNSKPSQISRALPQTGGENIQQPQPATPDSFHPRVGLLILHCMHAPDSTPMHISSIDRNWVRPAAHH
jgi:hypothetical protein